MTDTTFAEALAAAQLEMGNPPLDSANPHFRSRYSSLAAVRNAVIPILAKHGIGVIQDLTSTERGIACTTILLYGADQHRFGPLEVPATKQDAQGYGAAATYARRYALGSVAGIAGDEDTDAEAAVKHERPSPKMPDGYENWKLDMTALADEGLQALQDGWKKSSPDFRQYASDMDGSWWSATKARAGKPA